MKEILPTILIDTGEQNPLNIRRLPCKWANIERKSGVDYGIEGFTIAKPPSIENLTRRHLLPQAGILEKEERARRDFGISRKDLNDLCNAMGRGRKDFEAQMGLLARYEFKALVLETTRSVVEAEAYRSQIDSGTVLHTLDAFAVRLGIQIIWCGDHAGAAERVESLARMFARGIQKDFNRLCAGCLPPPMNA